MEEALQCQDHDMKVNGRPFITAQYWCVSARKWVRLRSSGTLRDIFGPC